MTETLFLRVPAFSSRNRLLTSGYLLRESHEPLRNAAPESIQPIENISFSPSRPSAIQGGEERWWIQFIWAVYYAAGTLIFNSIMAVTVIELFVWVVITCFTVAASKMLAFRLCGNWK